MCLALAGRLFGKVLTPEPLSGCPLVTLPAWCTLRVGFALWAAPGGAVPALDCRFRSAFARASLSQ
jgi:hypothetical protein